MSLDAPQAAVYQGLIPWVIDDILSVLILHTDLAISIYRHWPTFQVHRDSLGEPHLDGAYRSFFTSDFSSHPGPIYPTLEQAAFWEDSHDIVLDIVMEHVAQRNRALKRLMNVALVSKHWKEVFGTLLPAPVPYSGATPRVPTLPVTFPLQLGQFCPDSERAANCTIAHGRSMFLDRLETQLLLDIYHPAHHHLAGTPRTDKLVIRTPVRSETNFHWSPTTNSYVSSMDWAVDIHTIHQDTRLRDLLPFWYDASTPIVAILPDQVRRTVPTGAHPVFCTTVRASANRLRH